MARRRLPHFAFQYIFGGAEDEFSLAWNRKVFETMRFVPNTLVDTSQRSLSVPLLGADIKLPLVIAPTGFNGLSWPGGDVEIGRAHV